MDYDPADHRASAAKILAAWLVWAAVAATCFGLPAAWRETGTLWHEARYAVALLHA
jgi:hypothetical protein